MTEEELLAEVDRVEKIVDAVCLFAALRGFTRTTHGTFDSKQFFPAVKKAIVDRSNFRCEFEGCTDATRIGYCDFHRRGIHYGYWILMAVCFLLGGFIGTFV